MKYKSLSIIFLMSIGYGCGQKPQEESSNSADTQSIASVGKKIKKVSKRIKFRKIKRINFNQIKRTLAIRKVRRNLFKEISYRSHIFENRKYKTRGIFIENFEQKNQGSLTVNHLKELFGDIPPVKGMFENSTIELKESWRRVKKRLHNPEPYLNDTYEFVEEKYDKRTLFTKDNNALEVYVRYELINKVPYLKQFIDENEVFYKGKEYAELDPVKIVDFVNKN